MPDANNRWITVIWSIHLAFVIVFSTICGILAREWHGVSRRTASLVAAALLVLVSSTCVIAAGNPLAMPQVL